MVAVWSLCFGVFHVSRYTHTATSTLFQSSHDLFCHQTLCDNTYTRTIHIFFLTTKFKIQKYRPAMKGLDTSLKLYQTEFLLLSLTSNDKGFIYIIIALYRIIFQEINLKNELSDLAYQSSYTALQYLSKCDLATSMKEWDDE